MGRNSTGAWATNEALEIDISRLFKDGFLKRGQTIGGNLEWSIKGAKIATIRVFTVFNKSEQYLRLIYTTSQNGEKIDRNYIVELIEKPSNLGKGMVVFFKCPVTHKPCRKLYHAYQSLFFKSREAYQNRLYYPMQLVGKKSLDNERFWLLSKQIETLEKIRFSNTYAGKITRRAARMERLLDKQWFADERRWMPHTFPHSLRKNIKKRLAEFEE